MFEMILNPKKAERNPWEMFFIGAFYAFFSVLLVNFIFVGNPVFEPYASMLIITFTVMLSMPFMYFIIRYEEKKDSEIKGEMSLMKEHGKALMALIYLFLGIMVAFSVAFIVMPKNLVGIDFKAQIEQYCAINMPSQTEKCISVYNPSITAKVSENIATGAASSSWQRVGAIFTNNIYVLVFCILFSLAFGAGAIFILTWNASVIAAAIGIFAESNILDFPMAFLRYMIHGLPEIGSYFIAGLAGGIVSISVIRHEIGHECFWRVLRDSVDLIVLSIIVLFVAALIEVFITPSLF